MANRLSTLGLRKRISPKELASLGWSAVPWSGKHCRTRYVHRDGWIISHCGHPTALWPYLLTDPDGKVILTGAAVSGRADHGTAWPTVAAAADYVATQNKAKEHLLADTACGRDWYSDQGCACAVCRQVRLRRKETSTFKKRTS